MVYSGHLRDEAGRGKAGCPCPCPRLGYPAGQQVHSKGWVHQEGTGVLLALHSLGSLGISEATVPPGGHEVLPKGQRCVPQDLSFPSLSGALTKVCGRHFTNEAQTRQFKCPESHSQSEVGPELKFRSAWLPSHYRLFSLPVAAKVSHGAWAGRMPQLLPPSKRAGTTWICFVVKTLST